MPDAPMAFGGLKRNALDLRHIRVTGGRSDGHCGGESASKLTWRSLMKNPLKLLRTVGLAVALLTPLLLGVDSCEGEDVRLGGDYDPCGGSSCGDPCTLCDPADSTCTETAEVKVCQPDGTCSGGAIPMCRVHDAGTAYEPCAGLACGDPCTLCDPADPTCTETAVVKACQPDGTCSGAAPSCP